MNIVSKFGWEITPARVLVISLSGDLISPLLAQRSPEKLMEAAAALKSQLHAEETVLAAPREVALQIPGARRIDADFSPVLRELSALIQLVETGEVRSAPLEGDGDYAAIDGESLLRAYEGGDDKFILVNAGGQRLERVKLGTDVNAFLGELGLKSPKPLLLGGVTGRFSLGAESIGWDDRFDSVTLYSEGDCMAETSAKLLEKAREQSCQKCVLCREGSWHLAGIFQSVTQGKAKKEDLDMVLDIGPLIEAGAFCSFGQRMARLAVSSVEQNRAELEAHITKKKCPAGVCAAFNKKAYCIDPALCAGCGDCEDECPEMAIEGKKKFIYMIDPDMCSGCGACVQACEENAIVINDGSMKLPKKLTKVGKFK